MSGATRRTSRGIASALAFAAILQAASSTWAQLPTARLTSVFPCGAKQGASLEVTIAGIDLDDVSRLQFSHPQITAKLKTTEPGPFDKGPQPVITQSNNTFTAVFVVNVPTNVPVGTYEARAAGKYGISNPRFFVVDGLPEVLENDANNERSQAQEIKLETIVNGRSNGGADIDWFKLSAKRGQRVLVNCWGQRVDSRMEPGLSLIDAEGRELDRARYTLRRDAMLDATIPADGEYFIRVNDFQYRGGSDYPYRLAVSTRPHVDFVFPPAGVPGKTSSFTLYGRNLPGGKPCGLKIDGKPLVTLPVNIALPASTGQLAYRSFLEPSETGVDGMEYRFKSPAGLSNPVLISFATGPVVVEKEPNNAAAKAQTINAPCEVAGQFHPFRDKDWYTFSAKAGDVLWIECISERLGLPVDPFLLVQQVTRDKDGKEQVRELSATDDLGGNIGGSAYNTATDDPAFKLTAPVDGDYRILLRDLYSGTQADPRFVYRLSLRKEQPDFRLTAAPRAPFQNPRAPQPNLWSPVLRKGGTALIDVMAFRRDGFNGPVEVSIQGLPAGVTCAPAVIGPSTPKATLVLMAAANAADWAGTVRILGKAKVGGKDVEREARYGTVVWQLANGSTPQARLAHTMALSVNGREEAPFLIELGENKTWETARGGVLKIPVKLTRRGTFKRNVQLLPGDIPPNAQAGNMNLNAATGTYQLTIRSNTPPGEYTFYLQGTGQVSYSRNPEAVKAAEDRKKELDKILADANKASQTAATAKTNADRAFATDAAAAKQAQQKQTAADAALKTSQAAAKQAADKLKSATAALARDSKNQSLVNAKSAAEKAVADAGAKQKAATDAKTAADKAAADAAAKAKAATAARDAAAKAATEAAAKAKAAADAQRAAAQQESTLKNLARARNINLYRPSTTVRLKITPSPVETSIKSPPQPIKQGQKTEAAISLKRLYNYAEQVQLAVSLPRGVGGISIPNVNIPKGQNQGKLAIQAAANATPGKHEINVRVTCRFNNQNITTDEKFVLTVQAAPKKGK